MTTSSSRKSSSGNPRVVLIIQARMGSTRLPGKSMMDLAGAPLVGRILERVKRCKAIDQIVLATSERPENAILVDLAQEYGVASFVGSENDLIDRYYQAALQFKADIVGRLPADNVTSEPSEIDRIANFHRGFDGAYSSNLLQILGNGYPDGIGAEMMSFWALEEIWKTEMDKTRREHVGVCFYDFKNDRVVDPDRFPVATVTCPAAFARPDIKLDVNTAAEFDYMKNLYESLYPANPNFNIQDIIKWHDETWLPTRKESNGC